MTRSALACISIGALNLVEQFFTKIKHCRRVATRHDKLAENYLAALKLVSVRIWLRGNESSCNLWLLPSGLG